MDIFVLLLYIQTCIFLVFMKYFFLLLFFITNFTCVGQVNSYVKYRMQIKELKKAILHLENDSLELSCLYFKKALKIGKLDFYNSVQAAYAFSLIGDHKSTLKVVANLPMKHLLFCNRDTSIYCVLTEDILNDTSISKMFTSFKAKKQLLRLENRIKNAYDNIDWLLVNELKEMTRKDQNIRILHMNHFYENHSKIKDSLQNIMNQIDSINFLRFIDIIKEQGYPSVNGVGCFADYLLWHCNIELNYLNEVAFSAAQELNLDWYTYEHFFIRQIFFDSFYLKNNYQLKLSNNCKNNCLLMEATLDYINYYNIDFKNLQVEFTLDNNSSNEIEKYKNNLIEYDSNFKNATVLSNFEINKSNKKCVKFFLKTR